MTGTEGIDVANYQVADYATDGLGFVFVKATEGTSYVNPKHAAQVATGRAHGLVVGHYHFQRPGSPTAQATYFLAHAKPKAGDVLACDWEDTGVSCADKDRFIRAVQKAKPGLRVVLYCNRDFWLHRDTTSFAGDGLWIADPSAPKGKPRIDAPWIFHQYAETDGIDRNHTPLSPAQLRAWAANQPNKPQENNVTAVALTTDHIPVIAKAVNGYRNEEDDAASVAAGNGHIPDVYAMIGDTHDMVAAAAASDDPGDAIVSDAQAAAMGAQLGENAAFVDALADALAAKLATRLES